MIEYLTNLECYQAETKKTAETMLTMVTGKPGIVRKNLIYIASHAHHPSPIIPLNQGDFFITEIPSL